MDENKAEVFVAPGLLRAFFAGLHCRSSAVLRLGATSEMDPD